MLELHPIMTPQTQGNLWKSGESLLKVSYSGNYVSEST